jgi:site-specific DNA-methyltransferase (adenine-specific)
MLPKEIQAVLDGKKRWCVLTADCLPILGTMPQAVVDHVMTDPPYDEHTHTSARAHAKGSKSMAVVDVGIDFDPIMPQEIAPKLLRPARRWVVGFCSFEMVGSYEAAVGSAWVRTGIYRRTNGAPQFTGDRPAQAGEAIAIMHKPKVRKRWNGHGKQAYWESAVERVKGRHPTQKPLALMLQLIDDFTEPDDIVFDPFCGHGTTGVAALRRGRRFVGIELKQKYATKAKKRCEEAEMRWRDETAMKEAFEAAMEEDRQSARDTFNLAMEDEWQPAP